MGLFSRKSPRDRFADEVLAVLRATANVVEAVYDPGNFSIRFRSGDGGGDENGGAIYLDNTFRECERAPRPERLARIRSLVAAVTASSVKDLTWEQVAPRLRPVLRGAAYGQTGDPGAKPLLLRPALPYLAEFVVIDEPTSMAYVTLSHVRDWGVDESEVFATARANLGALAAGLTVAPPAKGKVVLRLVDTGDAYFTSMLLLDDFLPSLAPRVGGRPVAFAHARDHLTVIADEPDAVTAMLELIERDYAEAPRSLSPMAYTCDEAGRVVPYAPAEPGRLADLVHRSEVLLAAAEYRGQKEALDALYEREGTDTFVGSLLVAERPDGTLFSVAVWGDDCAALLPRADLVCFQSDTESVMVPWPVVARTLQLRPVAEASPERYRVTRWPDKPVLDQLREEAVTP